MNNLVTLLVLLSVFHIQFSDAVVAGPSCSNQPGVCWAVGDPHVRNFAGETKLFSTTGKVLMLSDKKTIWVRMKLVDTGRATQIVTVYIDFINNGKRTNIVFNRDTNNIQINYKIKPIPYTKWGVTIKPVKYGVVIDSGGIHIKWLNKARVFITMDKRYQGKVDGECGTYCGVPSGRGYSSASSSAKNRVQTGLRLDKPYNKDYSNLDSTAFRQLATQIEISIRKLFDPHFVEVKVTGAKSGSTIVLMNITTTADGENIHSASISKDIQKKIVEGTDKDGNTLGSLLGEKILDCTVTEPEVEMEDTDFDVEPDITAHDDEEDEEEEREEQSLQGQGGPYFGQSDHAVHEANKEAVPVEIIHHMPVMPMIPSDVNQHSNPNACVSNGKEYNQWDTIEQSYGTCTCQMGKWECHSGFGICALYGNDNIETFDEHHLKVDKECNYHLVSECGHSSRFSVSTEETYQCSENSKEKKRTLVLNVGKDNVMKIGNKEIIYNGKLVQAPKTIHVGGNSGVITITEDHKKVKISLNNELMIEWNRKYYYGISLRKTDSMKTCGLCGNFNGRAADDIKLPEHESECRAKHPGCHHKDAGFDYPKQVYEVNCDDIEKVEFPVYGEVCKPLKTQLLAQCKSCISLIPSMCLHPSNLGCIKQKEKICVTDLFAHFLRTCYTQVFASQAAAAGRRKKRDIRAIQLSHAISTVDVYKMSIEDINKALKENF